MSAATVISRACLSVSAAIGEPGGLADLPGFVARFAGTDSDGRVVAWRYVMTRRAWESIPLEVRPLANIDDTTKYVEFEVGA